MTATETESDLLVLPVVALCNEPRDAADLVRVMEAEGVRLSRARASELLARATALGLARITGYEGGEARYIATALGQRSSAALLANEPALRIGMEELERLRSELLATVGHELRTPLTAIRTSVGLLLDPGLAPNVAERQQLLATIARSADRMQRLLSDLLDLARLRAGRVELRLTSFDARDLARDVVGALQPIAASRDQRLVLELPAEAIAVTGDRERLEQAVLNLAANAQKFSPTGADVVVRAVRVDDGHVRWTVADRGPGIAADERARLFERFFVGTSNPYQGGGGSGIGLPTALAIAQAHGGTIEVESEVGRGSTFHVIVPTIAGK